MLTDLAMLRAGVFRSEAMGEFDGGDKAWPEIETPAGVFVDCDQFGLGGHGRLVWAEGDARAPVMLLLDNPGARERADGVPYVCGTRRTLRQAATESGLDTERLYVTFLVKCRPLRAYDREQARRVGLQYVTEQIRRLRPRVVALFGDVVVKTVVPNEAAVAVHGGGATGADAAGAVVVQDVSVRELRNKPLSVVGVPAVATYHPLAARRRPNLYPLLVADLARVQTLLSGRG